MRFFLVLITLTLISLSVSAKSIDQKKEELKKVYESGGITKTEYKKAIKFLENPKENENKEGKKTFSLRKKKENKSSEILKKLKDEKEEITLEQIDKLGKPVKFDKTYYPESMRRKFKGFINQFSGQGNIAGQFLFQSFKKRKSYQEKNPGELIKAMAMYEVFYASQLWSAKKTLERYKENNYQKGISRKNADENKIRSLIGMQKGQISMREALGMNSETPAKEAIKKFWLLGDFLDLGTGVNNEKLPEDLKKRKKLLEEYKLNIANLKKKLKDDLEEEEDEKSIQ